MLVQADGQYPRVVIKRGLYPVAVVRVDVHVGDALGALPQQPGDRDRDVVVHAEPAGMRGHGVVHAARDAGPVLGRPGPHRAGRGRGRPGHQRRCLVHAGEDRVVLGAQPEHPLGAQLGFRQAVPGVGMLSPPADRLHIRDVPRVVDQLQVCIGGRGRGGHGHAGQVPQPELMREPHGQLHPHRRHRMLGPEVIVDQALVPRHVHRAGHLPQPPRHRGAAVPNRPDNGLLFTLAVIPGVV